MLKKNNSTIDEVREEPHKNVLIPTPHHTPPGDSVTQRVKSPYHDVFMMISILSPKSHVAISTERVFW